MPERATDHTTVRIALRQNEAAAALGMSVSSFNRLVESGELPKPAVTAIGKRWLVRHLEESMMSLVEDEDKVPPEDNGWGDTQA